MLDMRRSCLAVVVILCLGLWLPVSRAVSQTPVLVRVTPAQSQVVAGETVDVAVEVVEVQDLYAFDVALTFDPSVVEVVDADPNLPGVQVGLGLFLDAGFAIVNQADNVAGTAHLAMTQLNPSVPKSGTGALIVLRLLGKQAGTTSAIPIVLVQLARSDGTLIPTASPEGGMVDVIASGGGMPPATPIPTQGAGTPMATPEVTIPPLPPTLTPTPHSPTDTPQPTVTNSTVPTETPQATPTATPRAVGTPSPLASATPTASAAPPTTAGVQPATAEAEATERGVAAVTATTWVPTALVQEQATRLPGPTRASTAESSSGQGGVFLWIAVVAVALAGLAAAAALILWLLQRRSASRGRPGAA